jgi:hypothetical protein
MLRGLRSQLCSSHATAARASGGCAHLAPAHSRQFQCSSESPAPLARRARAAAQLAALHALPADTARITSVCRECSGGSGGGGEASASAGMHVREGCAKPDPSSVPLARCCRSHDLCCLSPRAALQYTCGWASGSGRERRRRARCAPVEKHTAHPCVRELHAPCAWLCQRRARPDGVTRMEAGMQCAAV